MSSIGGSAHWRDHTGIPEVPLRKGDQESRQRWNLCQVRKGAEGVGLLVGL